MIVRLHLRLPVHVRVCAPVRDRVVRAHLRARCSVCVRSCVRRHVRLRVRVRMYGCVRRVPGN